MDPLPRALVVYGGASRESSGIGSGGVVVHGADHMRPVGEIGRPHLRSLLLERISLNSDSVNCGFALRFTLRARQGDARRRPFRGI